MSRPITISVPLVAGPAKTITALATRRTTSMSKVPDPPYVRGRAKQEETRAYLADLRVELEMLLRDVREMASAGGLPIPGDSI